MGMAKLEKIFIDFRSIQLLAVYKFVVNNGFTITLVLIEIVGQSQITVVDVGLSACSPINPTFSFRRRG